MISGVTSEQAALSGLQAGKPEMGKEDFLKLLVAQLSQQDPLNPQDGAEFVAQLAQFSSVEQLVNIRGGMDNLALAQQASTSAEVVGFIGRDVLALGDSVHLSGDGSARPVAFSLAGEAASATVELVDSAGKVVATHTEAGPLRAGENAVDFVPRSKDFPFGALPEGEYTLRVSAKDGSGNNVEATPRMVERVVGVTFDAGYPELMLEGGARLPLGDVIRVQEPGSDDPESPGGLTNAQAWEDLTGSSRTVGQDTPAPGAQPQASETAAPQLNPLESIPVVPF